MIWLGKGVLKLGKDYVANGQAFDPELVDKDTLDKLIDQKLVGEPVKVKPVKKKKKEADK